MILKLKDNHPIQSSCQALGYPRSSFYYSRVEGKDELLKHVIQETAGEWPTYGYRRITAQLQRQGWQVNHKKVQRLMGKMGLQGTYKRQKKHTTNSRHTFPRYPNLVQNMQITCPDQVWAADITYIRLARGFVYLAVIMDIFTRCIRGWYLSRNLDQTLTLTALKKALKEHRPLIHHSDQGVQYAASEYVKLLQQAGVEISMSETGDPTQNGYVERLWRTIKEEEVDLSDYQNFSEAYQNIERFLNDVYMYKRIHSALGYQTPVEFENAWFNRTMCEIVN